MSRQKATYKRRPGKFEASGAIGEYLYMLLQDGPPDDEVGDSDIGWAGLLDGDLIPGNIEDTDEWQQLDREEIRALAKARGAIVFEDSNGFFTFKIFNSRRELKAAWAEVVEELGYDDEDEEKDDDV